MNSVVPEFLPKTLPRRTLSSLPASYELLVAELRSPVSPDVFNLITSFSRCLGRRFGF